MWVWCSGRGPGRVLCSGSAQRGAVANKSLTASDRPRASIRGCPLPPCGKPGFGLAGFSAICMARTVCEGTASADTPQRIHSSRERSTPSADADSGCRVSETSTQAHTRSVRVIAATKVSASEVRPEHSGPTTSLMAPMGKPPRSSRSISAIPVGSTGQETRGCGESAEGIRSAREASICARSWLAEGMLESSPYFRLFEAKLANHRCGKCLKPLKRSGIFVGSRNRVVRLFVSYSTADA